MIIYAASTSSASVTAKDVHSMDEDMVYLHGGTRHRRYGQENPVDEYNHFLKKREAEDWIISRLASWHKSKQEKAMDAKLRLDNALRKLGRQ